MSNEIKCRVISKGIEEGEAIVTKDSISFLGGVDPDTGVVIDKKHELYNQCITDKILIIPSGKGSTVGSYVIYQMIKTFNYVDDKNPFKIDHKEDIFINRINSIFVNENVNYKIINGLITDIVGKEEINSINETINNSDKVVSNHFKKALELLYKTKDYDNSIKESITAVESICQIITGNNKATLGDGLKELKEDIHPALKTAFEKLYGYTSDANGIRHANGIGEGNSTFSEARYMLISCSAFINYLKEQCNINN